MTYDEFNASKSACRDCWVGKVYDKVVSSDGCLSNPRVMVIGEAPGKDEIVEGKPFVGKCGKLLRSTMNTAGYRTDNTTISNIIPCRPPDNKFPKDNAIVKACIAKWLFREMVILKPTHILLVGSQPLKFVLGMDGITRNRGTWFPLCIDGLSAFHSPIYCLPTFHPSYVLRHAYMKDGQEILAKFKQDIDTVAKASGIQ